MPRPLVPRPAEPPPAAARPRRFPVGTALLLALLCFAVRIPMLSDSPQLPADGHEYLNVARNLAEGRGFRKTIKWNFYSPEPAVHSALGDRPILYSIVLAPIVAITPLGWLPLALRGFSALLCALTVALAYGLWLRLYGPKVALAGGILLAVQPGYMEIGTEPLTEALLLLILVALFLVAAHARAPRGWAFAGLLCGLAYLTRPNGAFVLPILLAMLARKDGGKPLTFALLGGFLVAALPFWIANARANGSPFADDLQLAYAVRDVADATWNGYGHSFMKPAAFVAGHPLLVIQAIDRQAWNMLATFASSLPFLITFALFLRRRQWDGLSGALAAFGAINLVFYCLSWTVMGAVRYLLPTTLALMGPLLDAAYHSDLPALQLGGRRVGALSLLVAAMFFWYSPWTRRLYSERAALRSPISAVDMYRVGTDWLKSRHPDPDAVVLSNNPWQVDYYTHLPAIVCPSFRSPALVREFVREYRVKYIVLFGNTNVDGRESSLHRASLPGRFLLLPSNVRVWDIPASFWDHLSPAGAR